MAPSTGWWGEAAEIVPLVVFGAGKELQWYRDLAQDSLSWSSLGDGAWRGPDVETCEIWGLLQPSNSSAGSPVRVTGKAVLSPPAFLQPERCRVSWAASPHQKGCTTHRHPSWLQQGQTRGAEHIKEPGNLSPHPTHCRGGSWQSAGDPRLDTSPSQGLPPARGGKAGPGWELGWSRWGLTPHWVPNLC